jgi:endo-1,4-beta-xylanase
MGTMAPAAAARSIDRHAWRIGLACALAAWAGACGSQSPVAPTSPPMAPVPAGEPLRVAATARGKLVGTAVQSALLSDARYSDVAAREFNFLTAEYEMKWDVLEPSPGSHRFGAADTIVGFAMGNGMRVKGHTFLWHGATPTWVNGLSAADLRAAVERHILTVGEYFRGRVDAWDVVNEAVADDGSGLRDTVFRQRLGDGYIADAFRLARRADPDARLFYNDYGGEGLNAKSHRIYDLLRTLLAEGVPVDGVGLQMHISATTRPSDGAIAANIERLAALGLTVHISEMDVKVNDAPGNQPMRLELQRAAYRDVVRVCVQAPKCEAVTFWGVTDAHTWLRGESPLLFDAMYQPKPAYFGVLEALVGS